MKKLQEIVLPQTNVNDEFATVIATYYKNGDMVKSGDTVIEFETSKVNVTVESEVEGYIMYYCSEGDEIKVGSVFAAIFDSIVIDEINGKQVDKNIENKSHIEPIFSKAAKELIEKKGIDLDLFAGKDFVSVHDIENVIELETHQVNSCESLKNSIKKATLANPTQTYDLEMVTLEKISALKKKEIENLSNVQGDNLTSSISVFVDTTGVFEGISEVVSINNSLLPVIIFEISKLLQEYRELNAYFENDNIVYYKCINIGVAIDMGMGLKVVTIKDANFKSINDIEVNLLDLINKYIDNELCVQDISDNTFTITDLSSENVAFFSPLINFKQSSILGISSIDKALNRCTITVTFDHRITEGKRVSEFLNRLKNRIESYSIKSHKMKNQVDLNKKVCCKCKKILKDEIDNGGIGFLNIVADEDKYICLDCFFNMKTNN